MKNIILILVITLLGIKTNAQIAKAELTATGLTCSMCSNAINKQFKSMPEVDKVETDLNTNTFTVYLKNGNTVTPKILKDKVEKAGFFVGSLVLTMPFNNVKAGDNVKYEANNVSYIFIDTKTQMLTGETKVKVLDKGFVTQKEYKKLTKSLSKYPSYASNSNNSFHLKTL
jgi:copper chaperone CopZ